MCERQIIARLAQSAERKALNLVVVGSSPTVGVFLEYPAFGYVAKMKELGCGNAVKMQNLAAWWYNCMFFSCITSAVV